MKTTKFILIPLLLSLFCASANAQESVSNNETPSATPRYYDPVHPEYAGILNIIYPHSDLIYLDSGVHVLKFRFYGGNNCAYTLQVNTSNIGSKTFTYYIEGEHEVYLKGDGTVQLFFLYIGETANCSWQIYKYIED